MPHLYVLRRFSSWSFRLSASVALLLSSAGLAASLLAPAPAGPVRVPQLAWPPAPASAQATSELAAAQPTLAQALPVSLSSLVPAYAPAAGAPAAGPAGYDVTDPIASPEAAAAGSASTLKTTVQRSWNTFKLAFR